MLNVHRQVELREPVLLCAFTGWSDAASAASGALSYLLMKWAGEELASYDPETIYNYTITRPVIRRRRSGRRTIQWPALAFTALPLPHADQDLVVLVGPEPDLRWQACSRSAIELARELGVKRMLGLGCFYAPVAHSAPVPLVATATDRHVLLASTYSKSVLRVACEEVERQCRHVTYFPAYELVTGPQAPDDFFDPDRRNVSRKGIDHVMETFLARCVAPGPRPVGDGKHKASADDLSRLSQLIGAVECEELAAER